MQTDQYPKVYLYKRIVQAKLFIDNNYFKNIDLDNISDEANFSKFHFMRLFKNAYGKTPHQYLTFIRIEKAKQMLQLGKSISFACHALNFESLGSFSRLFKKIVGVTPTTFIEQQNKIRSRTMAIPLSFIPNCYALHYGWKK